LSGRNVPQCRRSRAGNARPDSRAQHPPLATCQQLRRPWFCTRERSCYPKLDLPCRGPCRMNCPDRISGKASKCRGDKYTQRQDIPLKPLSKLGHLSKPVSPNGLLLHVRCSRRHHRILAPFTSAIPVQTIATRNLPSINHLPTSIPLRPPPLSAFSKNHLPFINHRPLPPRAPPNLHHYSALHNPAPTTTKTPP